MFKLVTFSGYDNRTGPHIFPIEDPARSIRHIKMARPLPSNIQDYISAAKAKPGKTQLLIDAMGAGEFYGCFPAGSSVRTMRGEVAIEEVCVGDLVLTHKNRWRPVTETFVRPYNGELIKLYAAGNTRTEPSIAATPNHEFWIVARDTMIATRRRILYKRSRGTPRSEARAEMVSQLEFDWVPLGEIREGDYLAEPFPLDETSPLQNDFGSDDFAFLFGLYAAEGCAAKRYDREQSDPTCKVIYTVGAHEEDTIRRVHEVCARHDHAVQETRTGNAVRLEVHWAQLARACRDHIGPHARLKQLSQSILTMPRGWQSSFFAAYSGGDGCVRNSLKGRDSIRCTSASLDLCRSMRLLCARLGWIAQVDGRRNLQSSFYTGNPIFTLTVSGSQVRDDTYNVEGYIHPDGFLLAPVRQVEVEDWGDNVFNIEVEEDNSYTVRGFAVHNSNVNGDYFPEQALAHKGKDYGYETFMYYAYPFKHHVNKDPNRAYGEKVTLSAYDPEMHRVLLIVTVDNNKCADILNDLDRGHYWDVSMGCKVPWDQCSICKNKAKNRRTYCTCLRYKMNRILDDGRRVCALNWLPKFFDISFVTIGAEKASHVLQKVAYQGRTPEVHLSAEEGERFYSKLAKSDKKASERKRAAIRKQVLSQPPASINEVGDEERARLEEVMNRAGEVKALERPIPSDVLDSMARFSLPDIVSTLAILGIDLRPQEFQRIVLVKQGAEKLANHLERHRLVFDERHTQKKIPGWAHGLGQIDPSRVNEKVAMAVQPFLEDRSCYPEILLKRLDRMEKVGGYGDSQWYPMTDEEKRKSSGISGLVPASLALATGYMVARKAFPGMKEKGPAATRALARHPWVLPLLVGAGVGASAGLSELSAPKELTASVNSGVELDGKNGSAYHRSKTAGVSPIVRLGMIPAAYIYSGVQQSRWNQGERLNAVDRFIAQRPDATGLAAFALSPQVAKGVRRMTKVGGFAGDMGLHVMGSGRSKLMPAVLAGAALDSAIFGAISRLASKDKEKAYAHSRRNDGQVRLG